MGISLVLIAACAPVDDPDRPPPDAHPVVDDPELPPGVWEPAPGARIWDASLAADGGTLWWAFAQRAAIETAGGSDTVHLTATSATGESVVPPLAVDPTREWSHRVDVAITPSAVVVAMVGQATVLRRYDRFGAPLEEAYAVESNDNVRISGIELVAKADGGAQLLSARDFEAADVAIVDLDAAGTPTATFVVDAPFAGTGTNGVAAATRPDGSTIIAWDRYHDGCHTEGPATAFMTMLDNPDIGEIQTIRDLPDHDELRPDISAWGTTAYVAWETHASGSRIALAKYPDVSTVLAELGDPNDGNRDVSIVLTAADRGAIMWKAAATSRLNVVAFEERQGSVYVDAGHVVTPVHAGAELTPVGLVHVGGDRYVLGWLESTQAGGRWLFAATIDLATEAMRLAPPREPLPGATARTPPRQRRCI